MSTTASSKPSYLGLLNAIAVAEAQAECYLDAWAEATSRDDVRQVLVTVARREGEHAKSFAKRLCELGYGVVTRSDGSDAERLAAVRSTTMSDKEKFECLGLGRAVEPGTKDVFASMFDDQSIDIATGTLLGRYIAEERDSGRLLRACYEQLCAEAAAATNGHGTGAPAPSTAAADGSATALAALDARLQRIEQLMERLAAAGAASC